MSHVLHCGYALLGSHSRASTASQHRSAALPARICWRWSSARRLDLNKDQESRRRRAHCPGDLRDPFYATKPATLSALGPALSSALRYTPRCACCRVLQRHFCPERPCEPAFLALATSEASVLSQTQRATMSRRGAWMLIALHTAASLDLRRRCLLSAPLGCVLPTAANAADQVMRTSSDIGSYADATGSQRAANLGGGVDLGQEPALHRRRAGRGAELGRGRRRRGCYFSEWGVGQGRLCRARIKAGQGFLL